MQTQLPEGAMVEPSSSMAQALIRRCVHCGFCNATCPTYQLLGDERDGPRGRIYLIKQMLEGQTPTQSTQLHLDRCLTCRACETTCPSGVEYGRLVDIGRSVLKQRLPRPWRQRLWRGVLARFLTSPWFAPSLRLGQWLRPILPAALAAHVPRPTARTPLPRRQHARRVLLLAGCVQRALSPNINAATIRVLDALGIETVVTPSSGCCGAIAQHLDEADTALRQARRNIDAWWPEIEQGCGALVFNATGCGTQLSEYGWLLREDAQYAAKAARVSELACDVSELVARNLPRLLALWQSPAPRRIAFHAPCSLQHGLRVRGSVEALLASLGAELQPVRDAHLCCGSAGTYSLLQPAIAGRLRESKLEALRAGGPALILSANIGCIRHLEGAGGDVPIRHWIEWVDAGLGASGR